MFTAELLSTPWWQSEERKKGRGADGVKNSQTYFPALIFLVSLQKSDYLWITSAHEKSKWKRRNASSMKNWFVLHCFRHYKWKSFPLLHLSFSFKIITIEKQVEGSSCGEENFCLQISHFPIHTFINWFSISVY